MAESQQDKRRVDVVLLTAITLEYEAAKRVEAGAVEGSRWEEHPGPNGLPVAFRSFHHKSGRPLRVALAQAGGMGAEAALNALLPLVQRYRPRCVAMCGVCAGRQGPLGLGDVVAAERLFFHDTGKRLPGSKVQQDLTTYNLRDDWKVAIEQFKFVERFREESWWKKRPIPYEWQENWVLTQFHKGVEEPYSLPEAHEFCPQWEQVIESLWASGLVERDTTTLTDEGRKRIKPLLLKHRGSFPDVSPAGTLLPFKVRVAPMASGRQVIEDEQIWGFISDSMRKTLGLEMEAAALGALAHAQRDSKVEALVMKGVMDFANHGRDDHFKEFAARASAECLIAFLREYLEVDVVPDVDDLLVRGTGDLPKDSPPSALLNARYEVVPFHLGGREEVLGELTRWCEQGPAIAVRLLHAEGGVGKTRLAMKLIGERLDEKWAAGFLPKQVPEDWFTRLYGVGRSTLVMLDYAESRFDLREALLRVYRYASQEGAGARHRMRVLLLARNANDWWESLRQSDTALGEWLGATPPIELKPLAPEQAGREAVFHEAAEAFARRRGKKYVRQAPPPLSDSRFQRVLYLHMAALAVVEGLGFEAKTLMEVILDHEERFWEARARQAEVELSGERAWARQVVAAATLRGGLEDLPAATSVARRLFPERTFSTEDEVRLRVLHRIYQRRGKDSAMFLPALEPDLLGEGLVLRVASPKLQEDRLPPDWIERVLPADADGATLSMGLEVLGRASATRHEVLRPWMERLLAGELLHSRARLALSVAKNVGRRTEAAVLGDALAGRLEEDGDAELASELEAEGIPFFSVSLRRVAEWTDRTLLQALPTSNEEQVLSERARHLNNLGARLSDLGRREEALQATQEAVGLRRTLAEHNPDAFRPDLAGSLNNLGMLFIYM
jgi:nucleoside phosphorylase/tetratricopeptide (TPR) repeat protein